MPDVKSVIQNHNTNICHQNTPPLLQHSHAVANKNQNAR